MILHAPVSFPRAGTAGTHILGASVTAVTVFVLIFGTLGLTAILGSAVALLEVGLSLLTVEVIEVAVALAVAVPSAKMAAAAWRYELTAAD